MNFIVEKNASTPSHLDGVPAAVEWNVRVYGSELIQEIGILLRV
jgi:hypothetical protein